MCWESSNDHPAYPSISWSLVYNAAHLWVQPVSAAENTRHSPESEKNYAEGGSLVQSTCMEYLRSKVTVRSLGNMRWFDSLHTREEESEHPCYVKVCLGRRFASCYYSWYPCLAPRRYFRVPYRLSASRLDPSLASATEINGHSQSSRILDYQSLLCPNRATQLQVNCGFTLRPCIFWMICASIVTLREINCHGA